MLLDERHEVFRHIAVREHHGLTEHGSDLGAADIEYVRDTRDVFKRHVVAGCGQRVAKSCAVDEQRHVVLRADLADRLKFGERVERAVFGGLRNVDASGEHHVRVVAVRVERGAVLVEFGRIDFAVMVGERQHLVSGEFDGARLMHVHMACACRDYAGILRCDGVDDGLVGLRATYQEENLCVRAGACFADFGFRAFADAVVAVTRILVLCDFADAFDDFRCCRAGIVVFKRQHDALLVSDLC